ncbi:hypothetical protein [Corynebacterium mustelae]|uniref:hypothetical protein n=1 Tax=Corynebacterium mustelae TaxID=571915 RepID=UPI00118772BD|nr:hypothetical protein [Corynebacterium mustelae]
MAVSESKFELRVHTAPGIRFEYSRKNTSAPKAHIHYTGVAGIISPALMRNFADTKDPKKKGHLEKVHMPVGGQRFRPCLEDFLYFIIRECGFVGLHGWENRLRDFKKTLA